MVSLRLSVLLIEKADSHLKVDPRHGARPGVSIGRDQSDKENIII